MSNKITQKNPKKMFFSKMVGMPYALHFSKVAWLAKQPA
jgi:hypothetical protein